MVPRLSPGFGGWRDEQVVGAVTRARHYPIWGPWTPPRTPDGTTRSGGVESSLFFLSPRGMCRLLMSTAVSFFFFIVYFSGERASAQRVRAHHWDPQTACPRAGPLMRGPPGQAISLCSQRPGICSVLFCASQGSSCPNTVSFHGGSWWLQVQVSTQSCARAREFPETL